MAEEPKGQVRVSYDPVLRSHLFRFSGEAPLREGIAKMGKVYREHDPAGPLNIIFMDDGLTTLPTREEFVGLIQFAKDNRPACPGKTALVGTREVSFGVFRMAEGIDGDFFRHQAVFHSLEEAERWIAGNARPTRTN